MDHIESFSGATTNFSGERLLESIHWMFSSSGGRSLKTALLLNESEVSEQTVARASLQMQLQVRCQRIRSSFFTFCRFSPSFPRHNTTCVSSYPSMIFALWAGAAGVTD